jgi:pilus assembly protein CpaC
MRSPNDAERVLLGRMGSGDAKPRAVPTLAPPVQGRPMAAGVATGLPAASTPSNRRTMPTPGFSE